MRAVICIPTYNERENLPSLVEEVLQTAAVDVMILDDESPDGTGHAAELLARQNPRVKVVHRKKKDSMARAYLEGFALAMEAGYDVVFQMDADFSHQPRYLPSMLSALDHADVVIGSRYVEGGGVEQWTLGRRVMSRAGNLYARAVLDVPYRDATAGFVAWKRHVLEAIDFPRITTEGHAFQVELKYRAHRLGFTMVEVPILFWDRVLGQSKLTPQNALGSAWKVLRVRLKGSQ